MATSKGSVLEGKYRLIRRIAVGGMGAVFEGEVIATSARIAVKVLRSDRIGDPVVTERFRREARIAGSISHPHVCEVLDSGSLDDGGHYIVMPLLEGLPLATVIRGGPFSVPRALGVTAQILQALGAAHAAGVVHRDLKPSNVILMDREGRSDFVMVLDFGVSKLLRGDDQAPATITSTGAMLGTPQYMAPEQIRGGVVDHRIDLYACGVILYEMLVGARAFGGDVVQVLFQIVSGTFPSPREKRPDLPADLEAFVLRAMAKDAGERFSDTEDMLSELRRLEGSGAPADEPVPLPSRTPSASPRPSTELPTAPYPSEEPQTEPSLSPTVATPPAISVPSRSAAARLRPRTLAVPFGLAALGLLAFWAVPAVREGPQRFPSPPLVPPAAPSARPGLPASAPAPAILAPSPSPPPALAPPAPMPAVGKADAGPAADPARAGGGDRDGDTVAAGEGEVRSREPGRPVHRPRKRLRIFTENE